MTEAPPTLLLRTLLAAPDAAAAARAHGVTPVLLGDDYAREAHDLGGAHAVLAIACARGGETALIGMREAVARGAAHIEGSITLVAPPPLLLLSGGRTSLSTADGSGRRESERRESDQALEYLLGLALALDGHPRVWAAAVGPGGGASVAPDMLARARVAGADPIAALAAHAAGALFAALGDLVPPDGPQADGATGGGTVGDMRAVLVV